jgi:hypothetical protein
MGPPPGAAHAYPLDPAAAALVSPPPSRAPGTRKRQAARNAAFGLELFRALAFATERVLAHSVATALGGPRRRGETAANGQGAARRSGH